MNWSPQGSLQAKRGRACFLDSVGRRTHIIIAQHAGVCGFGGAQRCHKHIEVMNKKAEHWRVPDIEKAPPPHKPNAPAAQMATCRLFNTKHGCRNEDKTSVITKMENQLLQIQCSSSSSRKGNGHGEESCERHDMFSWRSQRTNTVLPSAQVRKPLKKDEHPRVNNDIPMLAAATSPWHPQLSVSQRSLHNMSEPVAKQYN